MDKKPIPPERPPVVSFPPPPFPVILPLNFPFQHRFWSPNNLNLLLWHSFLRSETVKSWLTEERQAGGSCFVHATLGGACEAGVGWLKVPNPV